MGAVIRCSSLFMMISSLENDAMPGEIIEKASENKQGGQPGWRRRKFIESLVWSAGDATEAADMAGVSMSTVTDWARDPAFASDIANATAARAAIEGASNMRRLVAVRDDPAAAGGDQLEAVRMLDRIVRPETGAPSVIVHPAAEQVIGNARPPAAPVEDDYLGDVPFVFDGPLRAGEIRTPIIDLRKRRSERQAKNYATTIAVRAETVEPLSGVEHVELHFIIAPDRLCHYGQSVRSGTFGGTHLTRSWVFWEQALGDYPRPEEAFARFLIRAKGEPTGGRLRLSI